MNFNILTEKEYKTFLKTWENKTFLQSIEIAKVNKSIGNEVCFLGVKSNEKVIAASLFIIKKNGKKTTYYSPRGLMVDYLNDEVLNIFIEGLKKHVKNNNGYMIKIDPYIELYSRDKKGEKTDEYNNVHILEKLKSYGFIYLNSSIQKKWFYILDIKDKTKEEVFNDFKSNVKNIIRKCEKIGIEIENTDDIDRFSKIVKETSERKNFSVRTDDYYLKMKNEFKENVLILIAKLDVKKYLDNLDKELKELEKNSNIIKGEGKKKTNEENILTIKNNIEKMKKIQKESGNVIDLAASMFCFYGNEVIYLFSGSKEEYLFLNAPYLIQWHIIQESIEKKYPIYNFYGIEDLEDSKIKSHGVYEFKKGFNGKVVETIGEMDLYIYKKDYYLSFIKKIIKKIV